MNVAPRQVGDLWADRRREVVRRCHAHVVAEHDWERVVDRLEILLRVVATERSP